MRRLMQRWRCLACGHEFGLHPGTIKWPWPQECPWCEQSDKKKFKQLELRRQRKKKGA
jgi:rubredoxin